MPRRRVRRPDTNAPGPRSRLPFLLWARRPLAAIVRTWSDVEKLKAILRLALRLSGKQSDGVTPPSNDSGRNEVATTRVRTVTV
jgi:hypothetical protein